MWSYSDSYAHEWCIHREIAWLTFPPIVFSNALVKKMLFVFISYFFIPVDHYTKLFWKDENRPTIVKPI